MAEDIIGLIPAAGYARRLKELGFSKELHPISMSQARAKTHLHEPKAVVDILLEAFNRAGVRETIVVIREDKRDITEYIRDGKQYGLDVTYVMANDSPGVPWTIDEAFSLTQNKTVIFGFPDILFEPVDIFSPLLQAMREQDTDIVLALFPTDRPDKADIVSTNSDLEVVNIVPKPCYDINGLAWIAAAWNASFTTYLHRYLLQNKSTNSDGEVYLGHIFQCALNDLRISARPFIKGRFVDIGTPDDLQRATEPW